MFTLPFLILDIGPMLIDGHTGMGPVGANTLTCYAGTCHDIHFDSFQSAETQKKIYFWVIFHLFHDKYKQNSCGSNIF